MALFHVYWSIAMQIFIFFPRSSQIQMVRQHSLVVSTCSLNTLKISFWTPGVLHHGFAVQDEQKAPKKMQLHNLIHCAQNQVTLHPTLLSSHRLPWHCAQWFSEKHRCGIWQTHGHRVTCENNVLSICYVYIHIIRPHHSWTLEWIIIKSMLL